jgi:hypothetical protein
MPIYVSTSLERWGGKLDGKWKANEYYCPEKCRYGFPLPTEKCDSKYRR